MMATVFLRFAEWAMPHRRTEWLRAMVHELPHIPHARRAEYALGLFQVSVLERIKDMTIAPPLRIVPGLLAAALLAVLCLANGVSLVSEAPVVGSFLLFASLLWLAMLAAVQSQSPHAVSQLAIGGGLFYAAFGALSLVNAPAFIINGQMLKILSLEGLILLAAAFAIAHVPYFWAANGKGDAAAPPS